MLGDIVAGLAEWIGSLPGLVVLVIAGVLAVVSFKSKAVLILIVVVVVLAAIVEWGNTLLVLVSPHELARGLGL